MTLSAVPSPPPQDHRQQRYTLTVVSRARMLSQAGWTVKQIQDRLETEIGRRPALTTIRAWTEPGFSEYRQRIQSKAMRKYRETVKENATPRMGRPPMPAIRVDDDLILKLRLEDELTFRAMSAVIHRFLGERVTVAQIRYRLDKLGVPRDERKARYAAGNPGRFQRKAAA